MHPLLLAFALLPQEPAKPQPTTFAQVVAVHFEQWDRNRDGTLGADEIDVLCVDADRKGAEAAAIAALKRVVRSGKFEVPPLTLSVLTAPPTKPGKPAPANDAADDDRRDSGETPAPAPSAAAPLRKPNFPATYAACLRRITSTKRDLFLDATPDLDACHQGPLGDCYFVATVGAFVQRNGEDVKRMLQPTADGRLRAQFGDGRSVTFAPLTDAEVALSGTTGDEGLWLPALEKALGTLRQETEPKRFAMETASDAIAKGGSTATVIRLLTGHQTTRIPLKRRPRSTQKDAAGKPIVPPPVPAGDLAALEARVRSEVPAALAARRLVTCGTGTETQPPGISGRHAYAVLGYDAAADALRIWNPHGNTFVPKGAPGLEHGYPTKGGNFVMPVADFVRVFQGVVLETDAPAPTPPPAANASKPPAAPAPTPTTNAPATPAQTPAGGK